MMNCKQATQLVSHKLDRELSLGQRAALRFHLLICHYCRNYARQLAFLHRAAPRLKVFIEERTDIVLAPEHKEKIRQSLQEHD